MGHALVSEGRLMKLDDILVRGPINRIAGLVVSGGEHYEPNTKGNGGDSEVPIAVVPVPKIIRKGAGYVDLVGRRFGRFTVLGLSACSSRAWVVRCDCGRYSLRTSKAIKNPVNVGDMCEHCRHLVYLRRTDIWRRTGKHVDLNEL